MKSGGIAATSLLAIVGVVGTFAFATREPVVADPSRAVVSRVVDGDTVMVRIGRKELPVRLIGIDTPETVKPGAPVDCFGPEASAYTKSALPVGTSVRLERDQEARDTFGRLLAYVYRNSDNAFINLELVQNGYARAREYAPNIAHSDDFATAAAQAERDRRGLWGACTEPSD